MTFQILISTMNKKNEKDINLLLKNMNIRSNYYIVNQSIDSDLKEIISTPEGTVHTCKEKGLSRSRNRCLFESKSDICLIADENVTYTKKFEKVIEEEFEKHPEYDVIAFYVENAKPINNLKAGRVNLLKSMKLCSVQIAFRKKSVIVKNILFDERFGAGSSLYKSGEENIFLSDCIRNKLKICYCPKKIGYLKQHESTWFKGFNEDYFISKGACYKRIFKKASFIINLQFLIRKHKIYKKTISFIDAMKSMHNGSNQINRKIFFVGDFYSNSGPANVNKYFLKMNNGFYKYSLAKNKFARIFELIYKSLTSDVICFCSFSHINLFGLKLCSIFKKKSIYLMHGLLEKERDYRIIENRDIIAEEKMLNDVDKIICVSIKYKNLIKQLYPKKNIQYVFNGLDSIRMLNKSTTINKNNDKFIIFSTGGDKKQKNNIKVCEAIASRSNLSKSVLYIIAGNLVQKDSFVKYDFVKCTGNIEYEECAAIMKEANLYIQNSYLESFGLSIVEALLHGCDLLISNNIGAIDILSVNDESKIFDNDNIDEIADKIEYKLQHNEHLDILSSFDYYLNDYRYRFFELVMKILN